MILLLILSIILIWLHVSSLRLIIRANTNKTILENVMKVEGYIPESEREFSFKSFSGIFSLVIIAVLNLIEIGYFVGCVYFFDDYIIIIGSSILVGYTIYSLLKFFPNIKRFYKKPGDYLKEKTSGFENFLSIIMTSLEIIFCMYILIKVVISNISIFK
ncbi:MAG: hypothetical protein ISS13_00985 [Actinobacteria bacterium]|nr:hypothetical protein [Actinomycetota bacterium]